MCGAGSGHHFFFVVVNGDAFFFYRCRSGAAAIYKGVPFFLAPSKLETRVIFNINIIVHTVYATINIPGIL